MPFIDILRLQGDRHCACAQKWCHFSYFPRAFKLKKIKALRPKMTKIASRVGSCLKEESNPLRSRCWISRLGSNPSPQWVPAYQHCWSMDRTICLPCSPMCETRSFVYFMCETPTASSPPLHQRTGEFLSSGPGEQSCWFCIFFEPCSTSLELFTCWRSGSTITVFF